MEPPRKLAFSFKENSVSGYSFVRFRSCGRILSMTALKLKGLIASLEYSNYKYENITLDGEFKRGGFDGKVALNDENGSVHLTKDGGRSGFCCV